MLTAELIKVFPFSCHWFDFCSWLVCLLRLDRMECENQLNKVSVSEKIRLFNTHCSLWFDSEVCGKDLQMCFSKLLTRHHISVNKKQVSHEKYFLLHN